MTASSVIALFGAMAVLALVPSSSLHAIPRLLLQAQVSARNVVWLFYRESQRNDSMELCLF